MPEVLTDEQVGIKELTDEQVGIKPTERPIPPLRADPFAGISAPVRAPLTSTTAGAAQSRLNLPQLLKSSANAPKTPLFTPDTAAKMEQPLFRLPKPTDNLTSGQVSSEPLPIKAASVASGAVSSGVEMLETPSTWPWALTEGLPAMFGKLAPYARRIISAAFAGQMGKGAYDTTKQILDEYKKPPGERDAKKIVDLSGQLAAQSVFTGAAGAHAVLPRSIAAVKGETANASSIKPPTEVHGDVQPQPFQGEGTLPAQKGGEGVQPQVAPGQRPPSAVQAEIPLNDEHRVIVDEEAEAAGVNVVYEPPTDPNEPFAGRIAQPDRARGVIRINPSELQAWLTKDVPAGQQRAAIRSLIGEEQIHMATPDADALDYHNSLSGVERAIGQRVYGGPRGTPLEPLQLGHEILRMRMQQLARMDVRETLERSLRERWTVKSLLAANDAIRTIRERLGTKASKEGRAIIDHIQGNLDAAIKAQGGSAPGAERKPQDEYDFKALQSKMSALDINSPTFEQDFESVSKQMEAIKNRNKGYVPGTEPQEPGATRKNRDKGQETFFLPPIPKGQQVERPGATESGALPTPKYQRPSVGDIKAGTAHALDDPLRFFDFDKPGSVKFVDPTLLDKPYTLGKFLTEGAGEAGSSTRTISRAVVALEKNGEIDVVHAYQDPDDLARLTDPAKSLSERSHVSIRELLQRGYKPVAGFFLRNPSKNFHEHFDTIKDYQDALETPAKDAYSKLKRYGEGGAIKGTETAAGKQFLRPEQELEGQARETGEQASADVLAHEEMPERPQAQQEAEAASIMDYIGAAHDFTYQGVRSALAKLADNPNSMVLAALRALSDVIREKSPKITDSELLDELAKTIYETHRTATDYEDFVRRTVAQSKTGPRKTALSSETAQGGKGQTGREISAPLISKRIEAAPAPPEVGEPRTKPRRTLTPEELAEVQRQAEARFPNRQPDGVSQTSIYDRAKPAGKEPYFTYSDAQKKAMTSKEILKLASDPTAPGATRKQVADGFEELKQGLRAFASRRATKAKIPVLVDAAKRNADIDTAGAKTEIIIASTSPIDPALKGRAAKADARAKADEAKLRREAGIAYVSAGVKDPKSGRVVADPHRLNFFRTTLLNAEVTAKSWATSMNPARRMESGRWLKAIAAYKEGVQYAIKHWNDVEFQDGAETYRREMEDHRQWLESQGVTVAQRDAYIPGLYEGHFWGDDTISFGSRRLLGSQYREPKKFENPYVAISQGPYYLASRDLADLAEHRINQGHQMAERSMAFEAIKNITDPVSKEPVAKDPKVVIHQHVDKATGEKTQETSYVSPGLAYELVRFPNGSRPIAVRRGYLGVVKDMVMPGFISNLRVGDVEVGKGVMMANQMLKHGVILILDTYHWGRLGQYMAAAMGLRNAGYKGGSAALTIRPQNFEAAVKTGYISPEAAEWAKTTHDVKSGSRTITMSNQEILRRMIDTGLNASKSADALYKDAVQALPIVGDLYHKTLQPYNRFLFDRFIPGVIAQSAVENFKKYNASHPDTPIGTLFRDVSKDSNAHYGNMGKQGVFRNRHLQDIAEALMLAPMWQEGLFQNELRFMGRLATGGELRARQGLPRMGALGDAIAKGIGAYLIGTQVINLATRKQFTWQNKEDDHKMDAWIPTGKDTGLWLNPLSVFMEVLHDVIRLKQTKPGTMDVIAQMGENRLGPVGKATMVAVTGRSPEGQQYTTAIGRYLTGPAGQVMPGMGASPIAFGPPARAIGHALAPNFVAPNPPGRFLRQLISTGVGVKTEPSQTAVQQLQQKATDFAKKNGLKPETGWVEVQTDAPSYSKLRSALRNGDLKTARAQLTELEKTHSREQIVKAMWMAAKRPFTGSAKAETQWIYSLSDDELNALTEANLSRQQEFEKFLDFLADQP